MMNPFESVANPNAFFDTIARGAGLRQDFSEKGQGFLGSLKRPDGNTSTELSIGVQLDGRDIEIPSLVPTLTQEEVGHLLNGGEPTPGIVQKAIDHAMGRSSKQQNPFY